MISMDLGGFLTGIFEGMIRAFQGFIANLAGNYLEILAGIIATLFVAVGLLWVSRGRINGWPMAVIGGAILLIVTIWGLNVFGGGT